MIGVRRRRQLAQPRRRTSRETPPANQTRTLQDLSSRRCRRPASLRFPLRQLGDDLARTPGRTLSSQTHDRFHQVRRNRTTMAKRRPHALDQPGRSRRPIAIKPLVACLAADPVPLAKLRHRPEPHQMVAHKLHSAVHRVVLSPRHRLVLPADIELSPIHPVQSVTDLSGPDTSPVLPPRGEERRFYRVAVRYLDPAAAPQLHPPGTRPDAPPGSPRAAPTSTSEKTPGCAS